MLARTCTSASLIRVQWTVVLSLTSVQLMLVSTLFICRMCFFCTIPGPGFCPYTQHLLLLYVGMASSVKPQALNFPDFCFSMEEVPVYPPTDPAKWHMASFNLPGPTDGTIVSYPTHHLALAQVRVSGRTRRDGLSREAFQRACSVHHRIGLAPTTAQPLTHVPPLSLVCQGADISWLKIQILQQPLTCALARLLPASCPSLWGRLTVFLQRLLGKALLEQQTAAMANPFSSVHLQNT